MSFLTFHLDFYLCVPPLLLSFTHSFQISLIDHPYTYICRWGTLPHHPFSVFKELLTFILQHDSALWFPSSHSSWILCFSYLEPSHQLSSFRIPFPILFIWLFFTNNKYILSSCFKVIFVLEFHHFSLFLVWFSLYLSCFGIHCNSWTWGFMSSNKSEQFFSCIILLIFCWNF